MPDPIALLTPVGITAFNQAANGTIAPLVFSHFKIGNGTTGPEDYQAYTPDPLQPGVINEVGEIPVESVIIDGHDLIIGASLPSDLGPFWVTEAALYDENDKFIAIASLPIQEKTAGTSSLHQILINMKIRLDNPTVVVVTTDPSAVYVTWAQFQAAIQDLIMHVQHGTTVMPNTATEIDVPILQVNPERSYLECSVAGFVFHASSGILSSVSWELINGNTIRFKRLIGHAPTTDTPLTIQWQVISQGKIVGQ